jgi:hypothetical protein
LWVLKDIRVILEIKETVGIKVILGTLAPPGVQEALEHRETKGTKGTRDIKETRVILEQPVV